MKLCTIVAIKGMSLEEFQGDICDRCGQADQCEECAMNVLEEFGKMAADMKKEEEDETGKG